MQKTLCALDLLKPPTSIDQGRKQFDARKYFSTVSPIWKSSFKIMKKG